MNKLFYFAILLSTAGFASPSFAEVKTFPYPHVEELNEVKGDIIPIEDDSKASTLEEELNQEEALGWDETLEEVESREGLKKKKGRIEKLGNKAAEGFEKLHTRLDQISIDFSLKQRFQLIDGFGLRGEYEYLAEPAFFGNYFTRMDGYKVGLQASLLELSGLDSRYGLTVTPELRVRFFQFFDSIEEARQPNNGYLPTRLPFTSTDVLKNLEPGDLVSFDGDLNFAYGYNGVLDKIADWVKLNFTGGGAMLGKLRIFIFRADNNTVRLRISAVRSAPKFIRARLSVFDLFDLGWSRLTEVVENALKIDDLFKAELQRVDRDIWLADYTIDLSEENKAARDAYDFIFKRENRYKTIAKIAYPFTSEQELRDELWRLLAPMTKLAVKSQNENNPSAVINFMGSNFTNGGFFDAEGGVRGIWRGERRSAKQDNRLKQKFYDADEKERDLHYFFPSWFKRTSKSAGLTLNRERKHQAANIIYRADPQYNIESFESIGFYREETDKRYDGGEHNETIESYRRTLPPETFKRFTDYLIAKGWGPYKDDYRQNVRISSRYFITEKGLKLVEGVRASQVQEHVVQALYEMDKQTLRFKVGGRMHGSIVHDREVCPMSQLRDMGVRTWKKIDRGTRKVIMRRHRKGIYLGEFTHKFCKNIKGFSNKLAQALDPNLTAKQRNTVFSTFTSSKIFRDIGPDLFDILGDQKLNEDVAYFEFVLNASDEKTPVRFSSGKIQNRPLYEIILQMEQILNEDEPDLRLPGTTESNIYRRFDNLGRAQTI